jgi:hypothetical protein
VVTGIATLETSWSCGPPDGCSPSLEPGSVKAM